jgi:hypothetical protein
MRGWAGDDHVVANGGSHDLLGEESGSSRDFRDGMVAPMAWTAGQASRPIWRTLPKARIAKYRPRG